MLFLSLSSFALNSQLSSSFFFLPTLLSFALVSIDAGIRHRRRIEPQYFLLAVAAVE